MMPLFISDFIYFEFISVTGKLARAFPIYNKCNLLCLCILDGPCMMQNILPQILLIQENPSYAFIFLRRLNIGYSVLRRSIILRSFHFLYVCSAVLIVTRQDLNVLRIYRVLYGMKIVGPQLSDISRIYSKHGFIISVRSVSFFRFVRIILKGMPGRTQFHA